MATWTQADIDAIRAAIATGVKDVTYAGPPMRRVVYHSLAEMRALLSEMLRDVAGATNYRRVRWRRGFRDGC